MNSYIYLILSLIITLSLSCKDEKHQFPLDKRYWDTKDYRTVSLELNYGYEVDEKLPSFDDPNTRAVVEKLTDHENYKVVLEDQKLGIKHRNNVAEEFFQQWKDMQDIYRARDRQDNYLYDKERLAVWHFGLGLQLRYFKLGNDNILANADNPDSQETQFRINQNVKTLINNFNIYLDEINNENAFSEDGKKMLAQGIDDYFSALIELYPKVDYGDLSKKASLLKEKTKSDQIRNSLAELLDIINSKQSEV